MEQIRSTQEWDLSGIFKKPLPWRGGLAFHQASQTIWALSYADPQIHSLNLQTGKAHSYPFLDVNDIGDLFCDTAGHLYVFDKRENKTYLLDHQAKIIRAINAERARVIQVLPADEGFILISATQDRNWAFEHYTSSGRILWNCQIPCPDLPPHALIWFMFRDQTISILFSSHIITLAHFDLSGKELAVQELFRVDERLVPSVPQFGTPYTHLVHSVMPGSRPQTFWFHYQTPERSQHYGRGTLLVSVTWGKEPIVFQCLNFAVSTMTRINDRSFLAMDYVQPEKKRLYRTSALKWQYGALAEQKLFLCREPDLALGIPLSTIRPKDLPR